MVVRRAPSSVITDMDESVPKHTGVHTDSGEQSVECCI